MENVKYKHYIIYKITNTINGKIYIGKHRCNKLDDSYFGSGKLLKQAIKKYGKENFIFHLEIDLKSEEEMDLLEKLVVNEEFLKRTDIYNISRGGSNPCMYGKNNPFYGKKHSKETRDKIASAARGRRLTDEQKLNIKLKQKQRFLNNPSEKLRCATKQDMRKCENIYTHQIAWFKKTEIPNDYKLYHKPKKYISNEQKNINIEKLKTRNKKSKWYNNGIIEKFCIIGTQPPEFKLGRLPNLNAGRVYSQTSIEKMRIAKLGSIPSNKGKMWITNGTLNKYICKNESIPDGWRLGLTRKQ